MIHLLSKQVVNPLYPHGEVWVDDYGIERPYTHPTIDCHGAPCGIHNPSDHHMVNWPRRLANWPQPVITRTCVHAVEHPDPDSAAWWRRIDPDSVMDHDCDGCCIGAG